MNSYPIQKTETLHAVIHACDVCYVAMVDENQLPYVLPFNFAFDGEFIYLHSAPEGKKIDIINKNPKLCIAFSTGHELYRQHEDVACSWSMKFQSVIVSGENSFIETYDEKIRILNMVMKKYSGRDEFKYSAPAVNNVKVFKIKITEITGKQRGY